MCNIILRLKRHYIFVIIVIDIKVYESAQGTKYLTREPANREMLFVFWQIGKAVLRKYKGSARYGRDFCVFSSRKTDRELRLLRLRYQYFCHSRDTSGVFYRLLRIISEDRYLSSRDFSTWTHLADISRRDRFV